MHPLPLRLVPPALLILLLLAPPTLPSQIPCGKSFIPCPADDEPRHQLLLDSLPLRLLRGDNTSVNARIFGLPNTGDSGAIGLKRPTSSTRSLHPLSDQQLRSTLLEAQGEVEVLYSESDAKPIDHREGGIGISYRFQRP